MVICRRWLLTCRSSNTMAVTTRQMAAPRMLESRSRRSNGGGRFEGKGKKDLRVEAIHPRIARCVFLFFFEIMACAYIAYAAESSQLPNSFDTHRVSLSSARSRRLGDISCKRPLMSSIGSGGDNELGSQNKNRVLKRKEKKRKSRFPLELLTTFLLCSIHDVFQKYAQ